MNSSIKYILCAILAFSASYSFATDDDSVAESPSVSTLETQPQDAKQDDTKLDVKPAIVEISAIEKRLSENNLELPIAAPDPKGFANVVIINKLAFVSGQLPVDGGSIKFSGKIGDGASLEQGQQAAQLAALNLLAQLKASLGSLDKVKSCIKITGYINAAKGFEDHPSIMNSASDVLQKAFGSKHARAGFGVTSLPGGALVEIEGIFEIE
jgi:enamine deaminase RidA (YjgF/YER057c/UK114 family)